MNVDLPQPDGFLTDVQFDGRLSASPIDKKITYLNEEDLKELRSYVGPSNEQHDVSSKYSSLQKNKKEWIKEVMKK